MLSASQLIERHTLVPASPVPYYIVPISPDEFVWLMLHLRQRRHIEFASAIDKIWIASREQRRICIDHFYWTRLLRFLTELVGFAPVHTETAPV